MVLGKQTRDATQQVLTADYSVVGAAEVRPATLGEAGGPWRRHALGVGGIAGLGTVVARSRRRASPARIG